MMYTPPPSHQYLLHLLDFIIVPACHFHLKGLFEVFTSQPKGCPVVKSALP